MKVYICPKCGWMRVVSRRKDVECIKCGEPTKLPYEKVGQMSENEREDYAKSWLYIHGTRDE